MKISKNQIIVCLTLLLLSSCAAFSKKSFREEYVKLTNDNFTKALNGTYELHPIKRFGKHFENIPKDSLKHVNAYLNMYNSDWKDHMTLDSLQKINDCQISLNVKNKSELHIKLINGNQVLKDTVFKGKLRKGMFYLDNIYVECRGIPYIIGGCENNKRRIGVTKLGNLIINEAVCNEGALLLVIGAGFRYNSAFEYKKFNNLKHYQL